MPQPQEVKRPTMGDTEGTGERIVRRSDLFA